MHVDPSKTTSTDCAFGRARARSASCKAWQGRFTAVVPSPDTTSAGGVAASGLPGSAHPAPERVIHRQSLMTRIGSCSGPFDEQPAEVFGRGAELAFSVVRGGVVPTGFGLVELFDQPMSSEHAGVDAAGLGQPTYLSDPFDEQPQPVEPRLAEIIQALHADAPSPAVKLDVDLGIVLVVLAQALAGAPTHKSYAKQGCPATPPCHGEVAGRCATEIT